MPERTPAIPASFHGLPTHYNQHNHEHKYKVERKNWKQNVLLALLIIVILYLLGSTIFLTVRVTRHSTKLPDPLLESCETQFALNAPVNPSAYPCSTCLPIVLAAGDKDANINIKQFCALTAIHSLVTNTSTLTSWTDLHVCEYSGVDCDSLGRITSLLLSPPGIPTSIPQGIHALEHLQKLEIVGDTQSPAGDFPLPAQSARGLSLQTLNLQATKISTIPIFDSLQSLTTLSLISNEIMDSTVDFIQNLVQKHVLLQNIIINRQTLSTNPLPTIANSPMASSLVIIDLTTTALPHLTPTSFSPSAFTSLKELHLDGNEFSTSELPTFGANVIVTV